MPSEPRLLDISELAAAAGVTQRTVRYYVQQGLLDAPGGRGPGTRYYPAHLERLRLIRGLQRQHLPLAEIRRRLEGMTESAVSDALAALPDERDEPSSAVDYVRSLLDAPADARPRRSKDAEPVLMMREMPAPVLAPSHTSASAEPAGPGEKRSTWERIALAPDVEIHVRRPLSREQNRQLERLMDVARTLFSEEL